MKPELITIEDGRWDAALRHARHDIYHTQAYVRAEACRLGAIPVAVLVAEEHRSFLLPLLTRFVGGSGVRDAVSPYGYPGPVISPGATEVPGFADRCVDSVMAILADHEICSAFVRLHPIINADFGPALSRHQIHNVGSTVSIGLDVSDPALWSGLRKGHASSINGARRAGFTVTITKAQERFEEFIDVYADTLKRLDTSDEFGRRHLEALANMPHTFIATASIDGVVAGAYMIFEYDRLIQLHLGGTRSAYMKPSPSNLLIFEIAQWGKARGIERVHLGGGVGGSASDSLFRFKAGFSRDHHDYDALRLIVDPHRYEQLVGRRAAKLATTSSDLVDTGFFPAYRASVAAPEDDSSQGQQSSIIEIR